MNRRGFLAAIAGGLVLDPERLLWRPGKKLISIPPAPTSEATYLAAGDILCELGLPPRPTFARFEGDQARDFWLRYTGGQIPFAEFAKRFPDGWHVYRKPRICNARLDSPRGSSPGEPVTDFR